MGQSADVVGDVLRAPDHDRAVVRKCEGFLDVGQRWSCALLGPASELPVSECKASL